ncbi:hypothetical protein DB88DRAFT_476186 [Papiliotrema laurentii]|uniref:Uncharacterized protein n=1 Tax=Papiliotrema laurentii TaxID=5418 RepID=A0AAD9L8G6_PAPLA|nr:hypothetical protein DB88DRAFT_476186 [Papiliotrema laurentii]
MTVWARLTSEEAALLVVAHLKHPHHDPIPKADLPGLFPHHPPRIPRPYPAQPVPGSRGTTDGEWVFMDDNVVTHLIRNSLGSRGWCAETRRRVLSMDNGYVKFQRDDTSAIVAFFDHNA